MKLTKDQIEALRSSVLDDSTKIIRYLEEQRIKQKKYNMIILLLTAAGVIASLIAAITGVIILLYK